MKHILNFAGVLFFLTAISSMQAQDKQVLVFYKTAGFWHESIPAGYQAIEDLGEDNDFEVDSTDDAGEFTYDGLKDYELVIFLNTTGDVLNEEQQEAFEKYINEGGNFFGIHSAADTEYDWKWYVELVGAYFVDHPEVQEAELVVEKPDHPTVAHLPSRWKRTDEWYNYKDVNPENEVLLTIDESTYSGGTNGKDHPIAWYRNLEGGGRMVYTGLGHTIQSYVEPAFVEHLLQSILFAMGGESH